MSRRKITSATAGDVVRLLGEMGADTLAAVLAAHPTVEVVEIVAAWRAGDEPDADLGGSARATADQIYDILVSDRAEQDDPSRQP